MIKAVVFDFDDTIVDTEGFFYEHFEKTLIKVFGTIKPEVLDNVGNVWMKNLAFEDIFKELVGDNYEKVLEKYREDAPNTNYKPKPGMLEFVSKLKEEGVQLSILSNRTRMLDLRLEQAGFNPNDFKIYEALERKPSQLAYTEVIKDIEEQGIEKEEVLVYGNHTDDYLALPDEWRDRFIALPNNEKNKENFEELACRIEQSPLLNQVKELS